MCIMSRSKKSENTYRISTKNLDLQKKTHFGLTRGCRNDFTSPSRTGNLNRVKLEREAGLSRESFEMERVKARDQAEKSLLSLAPSITNIY